MDCYDSSDKGVRSDLYPLVASAPGNCNTCKYLGQAENGQPDDFYYCNPVSLPGSGELRHFCIKRSGITALISNLLLWITAVLTVFQA